MTIMNNEERILIKSEILDNDENYESQYTKSKIISVNSIQIRYDDYEWNEKLGLIFFRIKINGRFYTYAIIKEDDIVCIEGTDYIWQK